MFSGEHPHRIRTSLHCLREDLVQFIHNVCGRSQGHLPIRRVVEYVQLEELWTQIHIGSILRCKERNRVSIFPYVAFPGNDNVSVINEVIYANCVYFFSRDPCATQLVVLRHAHWPLAYHVRGNGFTAHRNGKRPSTKEKQHQQKMWSPSLYKTRQVDEEKVYKKQCADSWNLVTVNSRAIFHSASKAKLCQQNPLCLFTQPNHRSATTALWISFIY